MADSLAILEVVAEQVRAEVVEGAVEVLNREYRGGPKTAEGLEISSQNALRHGLTGSGIHLPAELRDEVVRWTGVFERRYEPITDEAKEWVEAAALAFAQYRGALAEQTRYLVQRSQEAIVFWDDRRTADAEQLARRLPSQPGLVSAALRTSYRGAEWLLGRWKALRSALDKKGDWNEEEITLALDLLGIDKVRRPYEPTGIANASADVRRAVADRQCEALEAQLAGGFAQVEQLERQNAIEGKGYLLDKTYRKLERYAREAHRRYEKQIARLDEHKKNRPRTIPAYARLHRDPIRPSSQRIAELDQMMAELSRSIDSAPSPAPAPAPAPIVPTETISVDDPFRELRADPGQSSAVPAPRMPLSAEHRQLVERVFAKPADRKRRNRR